MLAPHLKMLIYPSVRITLYFSKKTMKMKGLSTFYFKKKKKKKL